jgi:hypothetical protein
LFKQRYNFVSYHKIENIDTGYQKTRLGKKINVLIFVSTNKQTNKTMFQASFKNTIMNAGNVLYTSDWTIQNNSLIELNKQVEHYLPYWKNLGYNVELVKSRDENVLYFIDAVKIEHDHNCARSIIVTKI